MAKIKVINQDGTVLYVEDDQIAGVEDDGSIEGVVRSKLTTGELIKIPADSLDFSSATSGTATVVATKASFTNNDGSNSAINMTTGAGIGANFAQFTTRLYGTVIGIRFRMNALTAPFSLLVDGIPYDIDTDRALSYVLNEVMTQGDREADVVIATNLKNTWHTVTVALYPGVSAKTLVVYGFICERRAGYKDRALLDFLYGQGSLSTTKTGIPKTGPSGINIKAVKSIIYYNGDAADRVVTLYFNATNTIFFTIKIPTLASYKLDLSNIGLTLGDVGDVATELRHAVDSGTSVTFTCIAGN